MNCFFESLVLVPDEVNVSRKLHDAGITSSGKMKTVRLIGLYNF